MKQNRINELREKYYQGLTSEEEESELFQAVESEVLALENQVYQRTRSLELPESFDHNLEVQLSSTYKLRLFPEWQKMGSIAASILLGLLIGILYHQFQTNKILSLQNSLVVAMADQQSPHLRLKALEIAGEMPRLNRDLQNAMIQIIETDNNINVKLSAFNLLTASAHPDHISKSMVDMVSRQESLLLQSAIINYLLSINDRVIQNELKKLMNDDNIREEVKQQIGSQINI